MYQLTHTWFLHQGELTILDRDICFTLIIISISISNTIHPRNITLKYSKYRKLTFLVGDNASFVGARRYCFFTVVTIKKRFVNTNSPIDISCRTTLSLTIMRESDNNRSVSAVFKVISNNIFSISFYEIITRLSLFDPSKVPRNYKGTSACDDCFLSFRRANIKAGWSKGYLWIGKIGPPKKLSVGKG